MIDFVKFMFTGEGRIALEKRMFSLQELPEEVLRKRNIEPLIQKHDAVTNEILEYPKVMFFQALEIRIAEKHGYVRNSLHISHNFRGRGEKSNYNDFTYSNICDTVDYLLDNVPELEQATIPSLEFGFNIKPGISAAALIGNNLLMHKLRPPSKTKTFRNKGLLKLFSYSNYEVKLYDKATQNDRYRIEEALLRYEMRYTGKELRAMGINRINDLKNKMLLRRMFLRMMSRYEDLLIIDKVEKKSLAKEDQMMLFQYSNPTYWTSLNNRQTKKNHKAKFELLLKEHQLLKIKKRLRMLLLNKFLQLINY